MASRKLDMGQAWSEASALLGANRDTIGAIAGLFFFLPSFAAALLVPELVNPEPARAASNDPQAVLDAALGQMRAIYADNWPLFLAISLAGLVGSLAILALLSDRGRPTVREALATAAKRLPSYLAAQLISALLAGLAVGLPLGLVAAFAPAWASVVVLLAAVVLVIYLIIKFALIAPVIATEGITNPLAAIARSWRLTKGNSLRIFVFLALLFLVIGIISALVQGILTLIFAAIGGEVATIGNGVVSAIINTLITVIFLVVIGAIHRQLAGEAPGRVAEVFE